MHPAPDPELVPERAVMVQHEDRLRPLRRYARPPCGMECDLRGAAPRALGGTGAFEKIASNLYLRACRAIIRSRG
jgi:hypothetical protein